MSPEVSPLIVECPSLLAARDVYAPAPAYGNEHEVPEAHDRVYAWGYNRKSRTLFDLHFDHMKLGSSDDVKFDAAAQGT